MSQREVKTFPKEFTLLEQCQVSALLDESENMVRTYGGDFTAPWLLSPINSLSWRISKGTETRYIDDKLTDFYEYQWATNLIDGSNLVSSENQMLLQGMQRLAFLARELPGGPKTFTTFKSFLWSLNFFVRWMFVHGNELNPRQHAFTRITNQHLSDLFIDLGKGGTVFALRYPQRFIQVVFPIALGRPPITEELDDPLNLSAEACDQVSLWLESNGYLTRRDRSSPNDVTLLPSSFAKLIDVDANSVRGGQKWRAFLMQFDSYDKKTRDKNRLVLGANSSRREMPSQRVLASDEAKDAKVSEKTLGKYFSDLKYIIALQPHLPEFCPNPMMFKPKEIWRVIDSISSVANHTPWVPLPIAMVYTTEALRWVFVYGEDLVSVFLEAYQELYINGLLVSAPSPKINNPSNAELVEFQKLFTRQRDQYVAEINFPKALISLKIKGFGCYANMKGQKAFSKLRISPSLIDAIMVLIGAITVVVTMTKPMRESEFRSLKNNCLTLVAGDGYWLSHSVRKKNVEDVLPEDARPIPVIAAKAILLLQRLSRGMKDIIGVSDPWLLDSLLVLPSFGHFEGAVSVPTSSRLLQLLDTFCDYVALPTDTQGRRWYLRIHEMRKSFLITFFWTYRYASLDAARWIAGHADASHVYAYIQANFPGEELPRLEAEYASQVLREYQECGTPAGTRNVDALYRTVCEHFSVRDVSWIDESTLRDWLELQLESREFEIIPHSITHPDGGLTTEISFRVSVTENKVTSNE